MSWLKSRGLAGLMLAATLAGAPLAAPAFAQDAAPAATAVAVAEAAPALAAPAETTVPTPEPAAVAAPMPDKGDTTWMLVSTVLVLLMIVPGLALFYGGLVRQKNMLS
ncbi:MAG: ammonia channel protein, partial [Phenylobacterium sp.]